MHILSKRSKLFLKKRLTCIALIVITCIVAKLTSLDAKAASQSKYKRAPKFQEVCEYVHAKSVLLVDADTGETIFARNPNTPFPPASILKLMTALLVYEKKGLNGEIRIQPEDTRVEPSHIPLKSGEIVQVRDMMNALLIGSDNDSAMALARYTGGSVAEFVSMMNARAKELGCQRTIFKNPHGLPIKGQVTTARDMLLIFKKVLAVPELRKIAQKKNYKLRTETGFQTLVNHNKLLGKYPGLGPAKTGWTYSSRHTYAASATRNGRELLLIILNSPNKWEDAKLLLDYGFSKILLTSDSETDIDAEDASDAASNPATSASSDAATTVAQTNSPSAADTLTTQSTPAAPMASLTPAATTATPMPPEPSSSASLASSISLTETEPPSAQIASTTPATPSVTPDHTLPTPLPSIPASTSLPNMSTMVTLPKVSADQSDASKDSIVSVTKASADSFQNPSTHPPSQTTLLADVPATRPNLTAAPSFPAIVVYEAALLVNVPETRPLLQATTPFLQPDPNPSVAILNEIKPKQPQPNPQTNPPLSLKPEKLNPAMILVHYENSAASIPETRSPSLAIPSSPPSPSLNKPTKPAAHPKKTVKPVSPDDLYLDPLE